MNFISRAVIVLLVVFVLGYVGFAGWKWHQGRLDAARKDVSASQAEADARRRAEMERTEAGARLSQMRLSATMRGAPGSAIINGHEYVEGASIPLTGSIAARVLEVGDGFVRLSVDGREVRMAVTAPPRVANQLAMNQEDSKKKREDDEYERQTRLQKQIVDQAAQDERAANTRYNSAKSRAALPDSNSRVRGSFDDRRVYPYAQPQPTNSAVKAASK